jgi:hypothetical protein
MTIPYELLEDNIIWLRWEDSDRGADGIQSVGQTEAGSPPDGLSDAH